MTDMEQAVTISGIIFGIMMLSQYGRRKYSWHKVVMPLISVSIIGYFYVKGAPTLTVDMVVYLVGAVVGVAFGALATVATGVERDRATGKIYTRCGAFFVTSWLAVIALRIVFIAAADHNNWFRNKLGVFMEQHNIVVDAIAPFFVVMALAMVVSRVLFILMRVKALPGATSTSSARRQLVTSVTH